jgi:thiamine-phosphate pyrophosphorylase
MSAAIDDRRLRLGAAHLYLACDARAGGRDPAGFLDRALAGGVDVVQLRDKTADDDALLAAAAMFRRACRDRGALFIVNDRAEIALAADADGVHVGQDDVAVSDARAAVGPDRLVGLSTHTVEQVDAGRRSGADYIAVGPVHRTPTKPAYPAVGLGLVEYAAAHVPSPWFAIGGIDPTNVAGVAAAGARRIVVVRAITDAEDPATAARALRVALEHEDDRVGAA